MGDQKNLILAIVLSVAIILLFQMVIAPPQKPTAPQGKPPATQSTAPAGTTPPGTTPTTPGTTPPATQPPTIPGAAPPTVPREELLKASPRAAIDARRISGSISLKGGLLDDVTLRDYRETVEKNSANVHLLNPATAGKGKAYYVLFGWQPAAGSKPI